MVPNARLLVGFNAKLWVLHALRQPHYFAAKSDLIQLRNPRIEGSPILDNAP